MNIDLIKVYEENKKIEKNQEKIDEQKELRKLLSAIVGNEKQFYTNDEKFLKKLNIKYGKSNDNHVFGIGYSWNTYNMCGSYFINLTKENIKKIQKYIDEVN